PIGVGVASRGSSSELTASDPKIAARNKTTTICFIWRGVFRPDPEFFWPVSAGARFALLIRRPHLLQNEAPERVAGSIGGPTRDANNAPHARDPPTRPLASARPPEVLPRRGHAARQSKA